MWPLRDRLYDNGRTEIFIIGHEAHSRLLDGSFDFLGMPISEISFFPIFNFSEENLWCINNFMQMSHVALHILHA